MSVTSVCVWGGGGGLGGQRTEKGIMEYTGTVIIGSYKPHSVSGVNQL